MKVRAQASTGGRQSRIRTAGGHGRRRRVNGELVTTYVIVAVLMAYLRARHRAHRTEVAPEPPGARRFACPRSSQCRPSMEVAYQMVAPVAAGIVGGARVPPVKVTSGSNPNPYVLRP